MMHTEVVNTDEQQGMVPPSTLEKTVKTTKSAKKEEKNPAPVILGFIALFFLACVGIAAATDTLNLIFG